MTPAGDGIELIFRNDGSTTTEIIPLHKAGLIRYFSAGVGVEERQAQYPPFLLKIIFVAGDRTYVTHTPVTISENEIVWLEVPAEHVTGPWLFVAMPPGTYTIRATRDGLTQVKENVKVTPRSPTTVYFRWR
jgi:hypothetical protein